MKFTKGDFVEMMPEAQKMFPNAPRTGQVTSILGGRSIRVRLTGQLKADTWHDSYWKRAAVGKSGE